MDATFYTIGDPSVLAGALRGMALFFGQDSWVASLIQTGLVISLMLILTRAVAAREGLRVDVLLIQILAVMAVFLPKTTVTIEQFDHAAPTQVVDHVPYAIAVPGHLASAFSLYMTTKMETVMSSSTQNYRSILSPENGHGPFYPAQVLLEAARQVGGEYGGLDTNTGESILAYQRYCLSRAVDKATIMKSNAPFSTLAQIAQAGQTVWYSAARPYVAGGGAGEAVTCEEAASRIDALQNMDAEAFLNTHVQTLIAPILQKTNHRLYNNSPAQYGATGADELLRAAQSVGSGIGAAYLDGYKNVVGAIAIASMARAAQAPVGTVVVEADTARQLFRWAEDEAWDSQALIGVAPRMMDVLFFVFIAATPLILFVIVANPWAGLKTAGGHLLFGIWSQSWIPMLAIIMYWYQLQIGNFQAHTGAGSTLWMVEWLRHIHETTIAASRMMNNAPFITFALLAGSAFGLAKMAQGVSAAHNAAPGMHGAADRADREGKTPNLMLPNVNTSELNAARVSANATWNAGVGAAAGRADMGAEMGGALSNVSLGGGISASTRLAETRAVESAQRASTAAARALSEAFGITTAGGISATGANYTDSGTRATALNGRNVSNEENKGMSAHTDAGGSYARGARVGGNVGVAMDVDPLGFIKKGTEMLGAGNKNVKAAQAAMERGDRARAAAAMGEAEEEANRRGGSLVNAFAQATLGLSGDQEARVSAGMRGERGQRSTEGSTATMNDETHGGSGFRAEIGANWSRTGNISQSTLNELRQASEQSQQASDRLEAARALESRTQGDSAAQINGAEHARRLAAGILSQSGGRDVTAGEGRLMAMRMANVADFIGIGGVEAMQQYDQEYEKSFNTIRATSRGSNADVAAAAHHQAMSALMRSGDLDTRLAAQAALMNSATALGMIVGGAGSSPVMRENAALIRAGLEGGSAQVRGQTDAQISGARRLEGPGTEAAAQRLVGAGQGEVGYYKQRADEGRQHATATGQYLIDAQRNASAVPERAGVQLTQAQEQRFHDLKPGVIPSGQPFGVTDNPIRDGVSTALERFGASEPTQRAAQQAMDVLFGSATGGALPTPTPTPIPATNAGQPMTQAQGEAPAAQSSSGMPSAPATPGDSPSSVSSSGSGGDSVYGGNSGGSSSQGDSAGGNGSSVAGVQTVETVSGGGSGGGVVTETHTHSTETRVETSGGGSGGGGLPEIGAGNGGSSSPAPVVVAPSAGLDGQSSKPGPRSSSTGGGAEQKPGGRPMPGRG